MVKKNNGFTLIEMLVSLAIVGIVGGSAFVIFITTLRSANKSDILREVKQNGEYAISVMERMIRNSTQIMTVSSTGDCSGAGGCPGTGTCIKIKNFDGGTTTFSLSGTKIASSGGNLTNDKVEIVNPPGLTFICSRIVGRPDLITISFTLAQPSTVIRVEEKASIDFRTTVSLRNY